MNFGLPPFIRPSWHVLNPPFAENHQSSNVCALCWGRYLGKLNILDRFRRTNPHLVLSPQVCPMCLGRSESVHHLLIQL